jgi:hypothetical protein
MTRVELLGKDRFRFVWRLANGALALAAVEDVRAGGLLVEVPSAQELWLEGELCGVDFSKSTVSALCKQLDPAVNAWNERPIKGGAYPFVLVDGVQIKVRTDSRVEPHSCLLAIGVNRDGFREYRSID